MNLERTIALSFLSEVSILASGADGQVKEAAISFQEIMTPEMVEEFLKQAGVGDLLKGIGTGLGGLARGAGQGIVQTGKNLATRAGQGATSFGQGLTNLGQRAATAGNAAGQQMSGGFFKPIVAKPPMGQGSQTAGPPINQKTNPMNQRLTPQSPINMMGRAIGAVQRPAGSATPSNSGRTPVYGAGPGQSSEAAGAPPPSQMMTFPKPGSGYAGPSYDPSKSLY